MNGLMIRVLFHAVMKKREEQFPRTIPSPFLIALLLPLLLLRQNNQPGAVMRISGAVKVTICRFNGQPAALQQRRKLV